MSVEEKLAQTLATMEHMEKLMEALNNDSEAVKQENHYLKAVVETNNDPTHPVIRPSHGYRRICEIPTVLSME